MFASLLVKLEHPVPRERKARSYPHGPLGTEVQQSHPKRRLVEQRLGHRERFLPQQRRGTERGEDCFRGETRVVINVISITVAVVAF